MLRQVVEKCPADLWDQPVNGVALWRIAYHALFYVYLYLQPAVEDFASWPRHRPDYEMLGPPPWDPTHQPAIGEPYTRQDLLDYIAFCHDQVDAIVDTLDLEAGSGFDWLPFGKLELQFYSIRHLQQHVGELCERLSAHSGIAVNWVRQNRI
jgi:hypothetical protein